MDEIAKKLCIGKYSSLMISFNESHSINYTDARDWATNFGDYYPLDEFPGGEEDRELALEQNSVWCAHWYPNTPVGFCRIYASSFEKLMSYLTLYAS